MPPRHAKARKLYLSDEAIDLLLAESVRSTYPMSVIVDMLIKKAYGKPATPIAPKKRYVKPELRKEPAPTTQAKKDFQFNG